MFAFDEGGQTITAEIPCVIRVRAYEGFGGAGAATDGGIEIALYHLEETSVAVEGVLDIFVECGMIFFIGVSRGSVDLDYGDGR